MDKIQWTQHLPDLTIQVLSKQTLQGPESDENVPASRYLRPKVVGSSNLSSLKCCLEVERFPNQLPCETRVQDPVKASRIKSYSKENLYPIYLLGLKYLVTQVHIHLPYCATWQESIAALLFMDEFKYYGQREKLRSEGTFTNVVVFHFSCTPHFISEYKRFLSS